MSSPLEKGRAEGAGWICPAGASFYAADNVLLAGISSHAWYEILRLSPHLFWLGVFTHGSFSSAQDDDTGERVVSRGGGFAAFFIERCPKVVFKSRVTSHNNDTSRPLEKGRAEGAGWIHVAV